MATCVDDCDLGAAKLLRALIWKVVQTQFAAKGSVQMQKCLGVVRKRVEGVHERVVDRSVGVYGLTVRVDPRARPTAAGPEGA